MPINERTAKPILALNDSYFYVVVKKVYVPVDEDDEDQEGGYYWLNSDGVPFDDELSDALDVVSSTGRETNYQYLLAEGIKKTFAVVVEQYVDTFLTEQAAEKFCSECGYDESIYTIVKKLCNPDLIELKELAKVGRDSLKHGLASVARFMYKFRHGQGISTHFNMMGDKHVVDPNIFMEMLNDVCGREFGDTFEAGVDSLEAVLNECGDFEHKSYLTDFIDGKKAKF